MGIYKTTTFKKENGKWVLLRAKIEKAPHDLGRWERSAELESRHNEEKTMTKIEVTKGGLNKKVVKATTYFPDGIKVKRELITTSGHLPKSYEDKGKKK